ncbi:hypothetical protein MNBD_BACTEROID05-101 [hydrothermal vent metagenome]|uniref:Uncharacterized protein n=1 Tax=hydrothermal vent metagenome TaxID=652676 RepID=A0A3B0T759_9ZZZZ
MKTRKLNIIILFVVFFNGCNSQDTSAEKSKAMINECQTLQDVVKKTLVVRKNLKLLTSNNSKAKKHELINRIHKIESKLGLKDFSAEESCNQLNQLNLELNNILNET